MVSIQLNNTQSSSTGGGHYIRSFEPLGVFARLVTAIFCVHRTLIVFIKAKCTGCFRVISPRRGFASEKGDEFHLLVAARQRGKGPTPLSEEACRCVVFSLECQRRLNDFLIASFIRLIKATRMGNVSLVKRGIACLEDGVSRLEARLSDRVLAMRYAYDVSKHYEHERKKGLFQTVVRCAQKVLCVVRPLRVVTQLGVSTLQDVEQGRGLIYHNSSGMLLLNAPRRVISIHFHDQKRAAIAQDIKKGREQVLFMGQCLLLGSCATVFKCKVVQHVVAYGYYGCHLLIGQFRFASTDFYESSGKEPSSWEDALSVGQTATQVMCFHTTMATGYFLTKKIIRYLQELQSQRGADSRCIKASQCEMVGETPCPLPRDTLWSKVVGAPKRLIRTSLRGAIPLFCPSPWIE